MIVMAGAVVVLVVAADAGRAGWVALMPLDPVVTASAPTAGTGCRTWSASLVTRKSAPSAARR
ncbi:MAG: hypothetical protein SXV54_17730 [Chloroflexota bacterium]|nr:hypothetical protein [Chloroflexota bacterium]